MLTVRAFASVMLETARVRARFVVMSVVSFVMCHIFISFACLRFIMQHRRN